MLQRVRNSGLSQLTSPASDAARNGQGGIRLKTACSFVLSFQLTYKHTRVHQASQTWHKERRPRIGEHAETSFLKVSSSAGTQSAVSRWQWWLVLASLSMSKFTKATKCTESFQKRSLCFNAFLGANHLLIQTQLLSHPAQLQLSLLRRPNSRWALTGR